MRIRGSKILVTGASQGIGRATALRLAKRGAQVWAVARSGDDLAALKREQENIHTHACDLTIQAQRHNMLNVIGELDIVINNAGMGNYATTEAMTEYDLRKMFELNFFSIVDIIQQVLPGMRQRERGHIVNVGSTAGYASFSPIAFYSATKHALRAFTDGLRDELAQERIGVSLIAPGPVNTGFRPKAVTHKDLPASHDSGRGISPKRVARAIEHSIRFNRIPGFQYVSVPRYMAIGRLATLPFGTQAARAVGHAYMHPHETD